jgi:hypothetical protein
MPEEIQARRAVVAILWVIVVMKEGASKSKQDKLMEGTVGKSIPLAV